MPRVELMLRARARAARRTAGALVTMLAVAAVALPSIATADPPAQAAPRSPSKPHATASKPRAAKPESKVAGTPVVSPYARAAAANAAERPHRSLTGRGQTTVQGAGHNHQSRPTGSGH